jgi:hypothetical protein
MADFSAAPVGLGSNVNPNQTLQTLSGLLGLKQQQQQLAIAGQTYQQEQVKTQQLQGVNDFFGPNGWNPTKHHAEDGTLDIESARADPAYQKLPGVAKFAVEEQLNSLRAKQLQNKQALLNINADAVSGLSKATQAAAMHRDQAPDILDAYGQQGPDNARALGLYLPQIKASNYSSDALKAVAAQAVDVTNNRPKPSTIETPTNIYPTTVAAETGVPTPTGQDIGKDLGAQMVTYPSGSLGQVGGPTTGGALSNNFFTPQAAIGGHGLVGGAPSTAPPNKLQPMARPPPNAPRADQENYQRQIQSAGQEFTAVNQAANDPMNGVQATRFRNQQVLDLAPHAGTGPGMKIMNVLASRLPGASGDAYQDLEHYAAQNSAALAKLMGVPGTNLGAETAAAAAGNVERNPGALKEITRTNDALNTAMDIYNRGLAKVTNNGSDMSKVPAYKQAFGQNLDVNAVRWADAHRRNDKEEIQQLQQKFGAKGVAGFTQKLGVLKSLAEKGDLP